MKKNINENYASLVMIIIIINYPDKMARASRAC